ncbi:MAG: hypothetical protein ABSG28_10860 [Methanoregula sp.]|jgi:hypothetical protein|uniref:hypothetical protein n=1 Tax=Methanoregula sp. TaxID=2052170 RepID=UPI003C208778
MDEIEAILIGAFIGAIAGSVLTGIFSWWLSKEEKRQEQKNIARALYLEIDGIYEHIHPLATLWNNKYKTRSDIVEPVSLPQKLYYYDGAYFVYQKEVASFNKDLSFDLSQYYTSIKIVESERSLISNLFEKRTDPTIFQLLTGSTQYMVKELLKADNITLKLKEELQKEMDK